METQRAMSAGAGLSPVHPRIWRYARSALTGSTDKNLARMIRRAAVVEHVIGMVLCPHLSHR